jgi:hypothetical protein
MIQRKINPLIVADPNLLLLFGGFDPINHPGWGSRGLVPRELVMIHVWKKK